VSTAQAPPAQPHFGRTKHGLPVHLRVRDYHAGKHGQFNRTIALWITSHIGTMRCFWVFSCIALLSLPATLHLAGVHLPFLYGAVPAVALGFGWIELDAWVTQNYIQLVLLPALMVGQNLQDEAADARSAKGFEDAHETRNDIKTALGLLDVHTEGGLKVILDAITGFREAALARLPEPPEPS
jgi:hypothetical protein